MAKTLTKDEQATIERAMDLLDVAERESATGAQWRVVADAGALLRVSLNGRPPSHRESRLLAAAAKVERWHPRAARPVATPFDPEVTTSAAKVRELDAVREVAVAALNRMEPRGVMGAPRSATIAAARETEADAHRAALRARAAHNALLRVRADWLRAGWLDGEISTGAYNASGDVTALEAPAA